MEEERPLFKIPIKPNAKDSFGRRSFAFSSGASYGRHRAFWIIATMLVGVSVPYFLIDAGGKAYEKIAVNLGFVPEKIEQENILPNLGSDEVPDVADAPSGPDVQINPTSNGQYYFLGPNYKIPSTNGKAYIVADVDTGEVIIEKNPDIAFPIASISKLIVALVTKQYMDLHKTVTVSKSSVETYGATGGLRAGEKILITDLLYPLLMESSNDAAEVLAEAYGYDEFVKHMNEKAKEIGMTNTYFFEPSGLSEKNVSTAADLLKLARYISKEHPDIWDISRIRQYTIQKHSWGNSSQLMRKSNFIGGKNGYTYEAYYTTISVYDEPIQGGTRRVVFVVLKSNAREADVNALERFLAKWVGFLPEGKELNQDQ